MGGYAVLKTPCSSAGQGIYTITTQADLAAFMSTVQDHESFIFQSLVGHTSWSKILRPGNFHHIGTIPNANREIFATDLRVVITASERGFMPVAIYARRARKPLYPLNCNTPGILISPCDVPHQRLIVYNDETHLGTCWGLIFQLNPIRKCRIASGRLKQSDSY
jgi:hypothetical protein